MTCRLSRLAAGKVNWKRIHDSTIGLRSRRGETSSETEGGREIGNVPDEQRRRLERVFKTARSEFDLALSVLRRVTYWMIGFLFAGFAVGVVGGIVAALGEYYGGGALSVSGLVGVTALGREVWRLGRDQAMLALIPAKYELALELARTQRQYDLVLERFLEETDSLRGKAAGSS